jgi:(E)-4-hydroxy-3-methylbut-2-enyl-diphosphate synthase
MKHCKNLYSFQRRQTREVTVGDPSHGGVIMGGDRPVVVQSMITSDTMNTAACVKESLELAAAGSQLIRITAPTIKDAANLQNIVAELHSHHCLAPVVADIHFKPEAGMEAARWVEKVRVNPGNFADTKKFAVKDYTDTEYDGELARIEEKFTPLVKLCKELGRAIRIGANHGSLSDRIMNRFGDTPLGMVESALEFARVARKLDFHNLVFSMKASNPKVMIESYRLLAARLEELGPDWNYPLHLGVTEAGEGEDGRIKSAAGIGALLADGLGDTIRVSLTEDSIHEIPVCRDLLDLIPNLTRWSSESASIQWGDLPEPFDPFQFRRRPSVEVSLGNGIRCGGEQTIRVVATRAVCTEVLPKLRPKDEVRPEGVLEDLNLCEVDPTKPFSLPDGTSIVTVRDGLEIPPIAAFRLLAARLSLMNAENPVLLKDCLEAPNPPLKTPIAMLHASTVLGALLADGIGDAVLVRTDIDAGSSVRLAYNLLQAVGCRSFKTDYVACPSCGRTLFNLQTITARIKARTQHLKGVKIAIMGCIVNGPGEMADADFGYVGGAPGKINLYVGKKAVKFNIPEDEAVDRLLDLVREHGKWTEPADDQCMKEKRDGHA